MASRIRSGLANHKRAYKCYCPVATAYTVSYNGNANTTGFSPIDLLSYTNGSTVTILANSGSLAKNGYTFSGWNTKSDGTGVSYSAGHTFIIETNTTLYAKWTIIPPPAAPILTVAVGGNQTAYVLFTQTGSITNYEYSTDNGITYLPFSPPQIYSPVEITTLSSDGTTRLSNGTTYTIKLRAVKSGAVSSDSESVDVIPTVTSLYTSGRIIYLDANNSSSYSTGTTWTNLESSGNYSATLNGSPTFNHTSEINNKYFEFNPNSTTGQYAQINQASAINPVLNQPFTIQMWARINNLGSNVNGSLFSKVFGSPSYDGYAIGYKNGSYELHENGASLVRYFNSGAGVLSDGWALYTAIIQFGNGGGRTNKLFINGRQVVSEISNESGIPSPTQNITFPTGFYGEGKCDIGQLYYYNTELNITQVIQNFDATKDRYIS